MTVENVVGNPAFKKFHRIAGHVFFLIMLIYAIVYAIERITYVDSARLAFERINGETFTFPGDRYGAFFSEILLFVGTKLQLSFAALVYIFSAGYILLYYSVWRICTYVLKNDVAGLVVIFGMVIGMRESFLHTVSETHQAIAYSGLLFGILQHTFKHEATKSIVVGVCTLLVLFTHPLAIFTVAYCGAFHFAINRNMKDRNLWALGILLISFCLLNYLRPPNIYDESQYDKLVANATGSELSQSGALNFLWIQLPHFYWLPALALVFSCAFLLSKKEWIKISVLLLGVFGFLIIAGITFQSGDSSIMIERLFLPAFFMINLTFAYSVVHANFSRKWIAPVVVIFFLVNGIRFINTGCLMYKKRVAYLDELVQKAITQGSDKYFLSDELTDREKILVPWALGTETLIYSKFKYDKCVSISMEDEICNPTDVRVTNFECLPVAELNPDYFQLSTNAYTELK